MARLKTFGVGACLQWTATCRAALFQAAAVILLLTGAVQAAGNTHHVNVDAEGFLIEQYDPVAYFTDGKPIRGKPEIYVEYEGAKYAFASEDHRQRFLADPDKYVPQYGGYCAYGVAQGGKSDVDPEVWEIVDGRLYLMLSHGTMSVWQKKKQDYIEIADKAWQSIIRR
jgi:YHS domain-containing protein